MPDIADSIARVADGSRFGTAFAVASTGDVDVLATCAHVIGEAAVGETRQVGDRLAVVVARGEGALDLAFLAASGPPRARPLPLISGRVPQGTSLAFGYKEYGYAVALVPIRLSIGAKLYFETPSGRIAGRRIATAAGERIERGYSGGPVIAPDLSGVVAIIDMRLGQGEQGLAISIEALGRLCDIAEPTPEVQAVREALAEPAVEVGLPPPGPTRPSVEKLGVPSPADQALIREIVSLCYRRAVFARLHAQLDVDAMFASLADCRVGLQSRVASFGSASLQGLAVEIISALDAIERCRPVFTEYAGDVFEAQRVVNDSKLRIVQALSQLTVAAGVPLTLPTGLTEDTFWTKDEADSGLALEDQ